jgi:hypothetical protein
MKEAQNGVAARAQIIRRLRLDRQKARAARGNGGHRHAHQLFDRATEMTRLAGVRV